jgi:hypothetical protein
MSLPPSVAPRLITILAVALGSLSCTTVPAPSPWGGPLTSGRARFNQSCGMACGAPVSPSTGEILAPAAARLAPVAEKIVQTGEALQGVLSIQRLLTEAELAQVEIIIEQCVAQAHADVNEAYQQQEGGFRFKNGKFPSDAECDQQVGVNERGNPINLAQELGNLKHAAAFACIESRLPKEFRGNLSIEPRYKGNSSSNSATPTDTWRGSLKPDIVMHATRDATHIQCVYELKFPCYERHRLDPMKSPGVEMQLKSYQKLSKSCRVLLATPTGLTPYEGFDG